MDEIACGSPVMVFFFLLLKKNQKSLGITLVIIKRTDDSLQK